MEEIRSHHELFRLDILFEIVLSWVVFKIRLLFVIYPNHGVLYDLPFVIIIILSSDFSSIFRTAEKFTCIIINLIAANEV